MKRETIPDGTPSGTQGWYFNLRRPQFADPRVREALGLLFDFEWTNQNIMFGQYQRMSSFFENSDMKAAGKPRPRNWRCWSRSGAKCRTRCSASRSCHR